MNLEIDWTIVKKKTLWNYEELIQKILNVMSYKFAGKYYNHNMTQAQKYATKLLGYHKKNTEYVSKLTKIFRSLKSSGINYYSDLIRQVETKDKCVEFLRRTKMPLDDFVLVLNHIFRWVLPHSLYLRELIDTEDETERQHVEILKEHGIRFNLDILEHGWNKEGRRTLSEKTGIPEAFILDLVNRADMSRLPYSNRKTVKHLGLGGYDSLEKLAQTDSSKMIEDMKSYFSTIGVKLAGFIDLEGIQQWARTIPKIVET